MTSVPRTVVDLAARLALPEALLLLDDAARRLVKSMLNDPRRQDFSNPRYATAARELLAAAMVRPLKPLACAIGKADPRILVEERVREDAVRETGHRVLRWMGAEPMLRPDELIGCIARALGHWTPAIFAHHAARCGARIRRPLLHSRSAIARLQLPQPCLERM